MTVQPAVLTGESDYEYAGGEGNMLYWAILFLIIAIIAALLGFTTIAGAAMGFAKILFVLFLILFIVFLFIGRK